MKEVNIKKKYVEERLDKAIVDILGDMGFEIPSRSFLKNNLGQIALVNGVDVKGSHRLKSGDIVSINSEKLENTLEGLDLSEEIVPQDGELDILFENKEYIVLKKQKGVVVHPGVGNREDTLANYVRGYLEKKEEYDSLVDRAGIVHRLDKGVSGLMVVAKTKQAQEYLKKQFQKHRVVKIYRVGTEKYRDSILDTMDIVEDIPGTDELLEGSNWKRVEGYIKRSDKDRMRMQFKSCKIGSAKLAVSHFLRIGEDEFLVKIDTGRMHQIRATLFYLGRYVKGDTLYTPGSRSYPSDEIELESVYLSFVDPQGENKIFNTL